ncbi:cation channel [Desmophyllum pertusum]|uniref:Cation channel n=1 Tax=Desmophyllum pertusum TaxID=174260 RepID=A0A9W9Y8I5_9CNID|nr:cation channel [Desmophyllum pertusum]
MPLHITDSEQMTMARSLFEVFQPYTDIITSAEIPVKTSIITLILYGFKAFLQQLVFDCPRDYHILYGCLFICGPAIILFCLSMLISESFWTLVTGCCRLQSRKRKLVWWKSSKSVYLSLLPPCIWLIFAFMEGDFYVCLNLGPIKVAQENAADLRSRETIQQQFAQAKSVSVIISWVMLITLTVTVTVCVTLSRILAQVDPKLQGEIEFDEIEAQEAVMLWNSRLQILAKTQAFEVIEEVSNTFKDVKDSDVSEEIRRGAAYLTQLYPRYGGVVSGHYRNDNWRPRDERFRDILDQRSPSRELLINEKKVMRGYGLRHTTSI